MAVVMFTLQGCAGLRGFHCKTVLAWFTLPVCTDVVYIASLY